MKIFSLGRNANITDFFWFSLSLHCRRTLYIYIYENILYKNIEADICEMLRIWYGKNKLKAEILKIIQYNDIIPFSFLRIMQEYFQPKITRKIRKKSVFDFEHKGRLAVNGRRSSNIAWDHSGARLSETLTTLFLGLIFFQFIAQAVLVFFWKHIAHLFCP